MGLECVYNLYLELKYIAMRYVSNIYVSNVYDRGGGRYDRGGLVPLSQ